MKIMPHGWMQRDEQRMGRPRLRWVLGLFTAWAFLAGAGSLVVWIDGDGSFSHLGLVHWLALIPVPVLVGTAVYFRFTEQPRPLRPRARLVNLEGPVIH